MFGAQSGRLVIVDSRGKDVEYELNPIDSLGLEALDLSVVKSGMSSRDDGSLLFDTQLMIRGKASMRGMISVIGNPENNIRELPIIIKTPEAKSIDNYNRKDIKTDEDFRNQFYPTATLGFYYAGWESDVDGKWWVECLVSQTTLADIADAIERDRIQSLAISLKLRDIYTNYNPSFLSYEPTVNWYLRPNKNTNSFNEPEVAHGAVSVISMIRKTATMTLTNPDGEIDSASNTADVESAPNPPPSVSPVATQDLTASAITALTTQVAALRRVAIWIAIAVVGVAVVLIVR